MRELPSGPSLHWTILVIVTMFGANAVSAQKSGSSQPRSTVVVVSTRDQRQDMLCRTANRLLNDELTYEFKLNVIEKSQTDIQSEKTRELLQSITWENRAAGAVLITRTTENMVSVAVFTIVRSSDETSFQVIDIEVSPTDDNAETIALRAAEIIHAKIIALPVIAPPIEPVKEEPLERSTPPTPRDKPLKFQLTANFSGEFSPGGTGFLWGPSVGGYWKPTTWLFLGVDAVWFIIGNDLKKDTDTASFDLLLGRVKAAYHSRIRDRFRATAGAGIGVGYIRTKGLSKNEAVDSATDRSAMVYVGMFCELRTVLTKRVSIPLVLNIGALPPGVVINFKGQEVARVGLPIIEIGLGVSFN